MQKFGRRKSRGQKQSTTHRSISTSVYISLSLPLWSTRRESHCEEAAALFFIINHLSASPLISLDLSNQTQRDCGRENQGDEEEELAMEVFYYLVFGALGAVVAALELSKTTKDRINTSPAFNSFKNNYLLVYSLMMGNFSFLCFSLVDLVSHRLLVTHCLFLRHSDPVFLWI